MFRANWIFTGLLGVLVTASGCTSANTDPDDVGQTTDDGDGTDDGAGVGTDKSVAELKAEWDSKCSKDAAAEAEYEEFVAWINRVRATNCPLYNAACPEREPEDCDKVNRYYDEGLECGLATFDVAAADACLNAGPAAGYFVDCVASSFVVGTLRQGDACAYLDGGCGPGLVCVIPSGSFEDFGVCVTAKKPGEACDLQSECVGGECDGKKCVAHDAPEIDCSSSFL